MYYMSQQIGIALGISFSSGLLKHQLKLTLNKVMINIPQSAEVSSTSYFFFFFERRDQANHTVT